MMKTFAALLFLVAFCQGYESNVDAEDGASEKSSPPISGLKFNLFLLVW